MKTYYIYFALVALSFFGCQKSDTSPSPGEGDSTNIDADYAIVLNENSMLRTQLLNANAEVITLNPAKSGFSDTTIPELKRTLGTDFLQYHKTGNCSGTITKHNFDTDKSTAITVFEDLNDCDLTATSITQFGDAIFISYVLTTVNADKYMVRIIDATSSAFSFVDISVEEKPIDLAVANNRLFILTFDEKITDENTLFVLDLGTNTLIHETNLGFSARRIFRNSSNNIIIGYDELHTTVNSTTIATAFTQYGEGIAPNFAETTSNLFDRSGRLYYPAASGSISTYPEITAIYDFAENLTTFYAYENFLTEAQRNFEFEIETTTAVGYDEANDLILIGYKKINSQEGGLLRIRPVPNPAFVDNIDLDGIPLEIIIN